MDELPLISIVLPTLNEGECVGALLADLQPLRARGCELIVVDGGSVDDTIARCEGRVDCVLLSSRGRARQMNVGAKHARGAVLWFLHADCRLPDEADVQLLALFPRSNFWGRFDVRLSGSARVFRVIEFMINARSRLTGIATGDQGMFVSRELFVAVGGFPDMPLMEDVALSTSLRKLARPVCLRRRLVTLSRRWERYGIARTVLLMWWLRLRFALGADPQKLVRVYYRSGD